MHRAGRASLRLHLDHFRDVPPEVDAPLLGPLVGELAHRRGRRDRVDGDDFRKAVRHARRGFVSVESDHRVRCHGRKVGPYSEHRNDADCGTPRVRDRPAERPPRFGPAEVFGVNASWRDGPGLLFLLQEKLRGVRALPDEPRQNRSTHEDHGCDRWIARQRCRPEVRRASDFRGAGERARRLDGRDAKRTFGRTREVAHDADPQGTAQKVLDRAARDMGERRGTAVFTS